MSEAAADEDIFQREMFLEFVREGTPHEIAAFEVGWTPRKYQRVMEDDGFAELVEAAQDHSISSIEQVLFKVAQRGNLQAIKFYLTNRRPNSWKEGSALKVEVTDGTAPAVIAATAEAIRSTIQDLVRTPGAIAQLQRPALTIIEAEVIEDGDDEAESEGD